MSNHVSEWLNAYFDGELAGKKLQQVEEHLSACDLCRRELESLQQISGLLHELPEPELFSVDRFASQVNLRLPHEKAITSNRSVIGFGWWMIPVGLVASLVFVNVAFALSDLLAVAGSLGVLSGMSDWLTSSPSNDIYLSTTIGQMGVLSGNGLSWAETLETFTRVSLPQVILQISIAMLYLGWIAVWWARHMRREHGQLLEG